MIDKINTEEICKPTLKMETRHFIIKYSEMDKTCIDKLSDVLEVNYDKLYNLIKSPNNFVEVFGMIENELQNEWIKYIKKNYILN